MRGTLEAWERTHIANQYWYVQNKAEKKRVSAEIRIMCANYIKGL